MKLNRLYIIVNVVTTLFLAACEHKELCYHHPHTQKVRIEFDWRDAPNACPKGMCVFFYPLDHDGAAQRFDFPEAIGGEREVQVGKYRVLTYNNDTEAVLFRGTERLATHEGYTRNGHILESIYGNGTKYVKDQEAEGERVVICPDMMWGYTEAEVEITETGISLVTLYPHELICTYTYEIRNVKNLKHATQMCGSLSGMASSLFFGSEELGMECVTIPFESSSDGISRITGRFYTFGHHNANAAPHKMLLYVWMDDGKKYYYTFDVTEQVHTAPDPRHVHIVIDGPALPQPIENGSGFDVAVDDWQVVEEDIII